MTINTFGSPHTALDGSGIFFNDDDFFNRNYLNSQLTLQEYYIPPISMTGLSRLPKVNPHHGAMVSFKANMLLKYFDASNSIISRETFKRLAIDYNTFGNAYLNVIKNVNGVTVAVRHLPAINTRRKAGNIYTYLKPDNTLIDFAVGEIVHLMDYDAEQQIYGIPYWIGSLQSILLGEEARMFPRKYFKNGAVTGNIIVTAGLGSDEEGVLDDTFSGAKGDGNWKTMHIGFKNGTDVEKMLKVIALSNEGAKIDFTKFMSASATDILEAWRVRPELAGMMPENTGGTGDLSKIMDLYYQFEVIPYQQEFEIINRFLPDFAKIKFITPIVMPVL